MTVQNAAHYHAVASRIVHPGRAFIDGALVAASSGAVMETIDPATGEVLAAVAHCQAVDVPRDEIFGPVLGVLPVDGMEQALALANASEYGLHATVYTKDIDRTLFLSRRLACGTVTINGFTEGDIKTPFGGYRQSGSLSRDKGTEAMAQYLQTKTNWITLRQLVAS